MKMKACVYVVLRNILRRSRKWHRYPSSDSVGLIFTRSHRSYDSDSDSVARENQPLQNDAYTICNTILKTTYILFIYLFIIYFNYLFVSCHIFAQKLYTTFYLYVFYITLQSSELIQTESLSHRLKTENLSHRLVTQTENWKFFTQTCHTDLSHRLVTQTCHTDWKLKICHTDWKLKVCHTDLSHRLVTHRARHCAWYSRQYA